MNNLIIGAYRINMYHIDRARYCLVLPECACCKKTIPEEHWIDSCSGQPQIMSSPDNYIRIIFGVHPEIYSSQDGPVPAIFTPVYFCKECEKDKGPYLALLKIFLSFEPMIHPSALVSQFDPQRGCWITIWPLDTQSQPTWPINYQVNLSTFREITEKMLNIPDNPFCVSRR